jgi:NADH:ubiquinone oxidoreductase subunit 6 (subunit J)
MEPIVSPWFIYWLGVLGGLEVFLLVLSVVTAILAVIYLLCSVDDDTDKNNRHAYAKKSRGFLILLAFIALLMVLTPSKETVIAMYASRHVTKNSLSTAAGVVSKTAEDIKMDIIDIIRAFTEKPDSTNNKRR